MKIKEEDLRFLVVCTKSDYWFTKICIASIRYYYPEQEILLIKDVLGGDFATTEIEKYFNVTLLSYSDSRYGISAAKMFFYCDEEKSNSYV